MGGWRHLSTFVMALGLAVTGCSFPNGTSATGPAEVVELPGGPDYPLFDHTLTWADGELIILGGAGGDVDDGLLVDDPLAWHPDRGFRAIARPPGPVRSRQMAVWTGDELLVWSGTSEPFGVGNGLLATTVSYDPSTDTWRERSPSPPELGRVGASAAIVDRTVVVAGGTTPSDDDAGRIGLYHLDDDRWSQTSVAGATLAVAGDQSRSFVLWSLGHTEPFPVQLSEVLIGPDGAASFVHLGFDGPETFAGAGDLAIVDDRLVVWLSDGTETELITSSPLDRAPPTGWRSIALGGVGAPSGNPTAQRLTTVDGRIVAEEAGVLVWVDPETGATIRQSLTSTERCALESGAASTGDRLIAIGGWCLAVDEDGAERSLFGSFAFEPPPR